MPACDVCGREFDTDHGLRTHRGMGCDPFTYDCDICGDEFVRTPASNIVRCDDCRDAGRATPAMEASTFAAGDDHPMKDPTVVERMVANRDNDALARSIAALRQRESARGVHVFQQKSFWDDHLERISGENHYRWKGGDGTPYGDGWGYALRTRIRRRDFRCCRLCRTPQTEFSQRLDVHHRDGDKQNCDPANLISLCRGCHMKVEAHGVAL